MSLSSANEYMANINIGIEVNAIFITSFRCCHVNFSWKIACFFFSRPHVDYANIVE